jgi:hypothetical protein
VFDKLIQVLVLGAAYNKIAVVVPGLVEVEVAVPCPHRP